MNLCRYYLEIPELRRQKTLPPLTLPPVNSLAIENSLLSLLRPESPVLPIFLAPNQFLAFLRLFSEAFYYFLYIMFNLPSVGGIYISWDEEHGALHSVLFSKAISCLLYTTFHSGLLFFHTASIFLLFACFLFMLGCSAACAPPRSPSISFYCVSHIFFSLLSASLVLGRQWSQQQQAAITGGLEVLRTRRKSELLCWQGAEDASRRNEKRKEGLPLKY